MPRIDLPNTGPGRPPLKPVELIWVTGTCSLMAFLALTPQLFIIGPYYRNNPAFTFTQLLAVLVPFNAAILAVFCNYHLANSSDDDRDDGHEHEHAPTSKNANPLAVPRFCKTCNSYKPPRTHHCKQCRSCTLKMDHHCPWIANCIGHNNAPHFLRFLYATEFALLFHSILISARIADYWSPPGAYWIPPGTPEMVLIIFNYIAALIVGFLVGIFCVYHTWLLANGNTTIESSERERVRTMVRRGRIREIRYPFDLGPFANICSVLGPTPLHWFIPGLQTQSGDGLVFRYRNGTPPWLPFAWPPRDPTHSHHSRHSQQHISPSAMRKRAELEQGWEWERERAQARDDQGGAYASAHAFTYGAERLNPALQPSNIQRRREKDNHSPPEGLRPRVRRGSEGVEIKPRRFDLTFAHEQREWELDHQGDTEEIHHSGPSYMRGLPAAIPDSDDDDNHSMDEHGHRLGTSVQPAFNTTSHGSNQHRKGPSYVSDGESDDDDDDDDGPIYLSDPSFPQVDMSEVAPLHESRRASVTQAEEVDESDAYMPAYGGEDGYGSPALLSREQSVHSLTHAARSIIGGGGGPNAMPEFALDSNDSSLERHHIGDEEGVDGLGRDGRRLARRDSSLSDVEAWLEGQQEPEYDHHREEHKVDDGVHDDDEEEKEEEEEEEGRDNDGDEEEVVRAKTKAKAKARARAKVQKRRRRLSFTSCSSSSSDSSSSSSSAASKSSGFRSRSGTVSTTTQHTTQAQAQQAQAQGTEGGLAGFIDTAASPHT
ncbi:unnamed protein product [Tilletia controversa]|nr:unnamed protein product [Tilletia controversa]CAD6974301.1 unnamed protein product [Tilletia controversa]